MSTMSNAAPNQDTQGNRNVDAKRDISTPAPAFPCITVTSPEFSPEKEAGNEDVTTESTMPKIFETDQTGVKSQFKPSRSISEGADQGSVGSFNRLSSLGASPPHGHDKKLNAMELR